MPSPAEQSIFVMHGCRDAVAGGMMHIEQQVKAIELAVAENAGLAFDLAKTIIESACKTILAERKIVFADDDDLPRLFRTTTQNLPFLPPEAATDAETRKSLEKTLSGLSTALHGVCELRNRHGFASHGREGPTVVMEQVQAILTAQTADAIVGFLFRTHRQSGLRRAAPRLEYDDNPDFNQYVDELHPVVRIFALEYQPSEVLFSTDPEAYRDTLADFDAQEATHEGDQPDESPTQVTP